MAAVTHGVSTASSLNDTTYPSGSFTPAANDFMVVFVAAAATVVSNPTLTDSQGVGFLQYTSSTRGGGTAYLFVAHALAAAVARTVTFDCSGDAATGAVICVALVSGMTSLGSASVRQVGIFNGAAAGTPAGTFGAGSTAVLTTNPTLGFLMNNTNPTGVTEPTGWTEREDTGFATPTTGAEYVSRDSGFTGTSITWGSTSASQFAGIIVELDASAPVVQLARPDAELVAGTWTPSVALAPLHEMLDETTPSDADYITSSATPVHDTAQVGLSPLTTPGEGTVTLRVRARLES